MFRGTPPLLRVALRYRKRAILAVPLATITFLYGSYRPEYYQSSSFVEHDDPPPLLHDPLVVQAELGEFPDYYLAITGQTLHSHNEQNPKDHPETPPSLLLTTSDPNDRTFSFEDDDLPLPPPQPTFTPGIPKPPNEAYTKAIIIAHTSSERVDWIRNLILSSPPPPYPSQPPRTNLTTQWESYLYLTDEIFPVHDTSQNQQVHRHHTPLNKGRESLAYLSYIISHYDVLPDISVFMHAHASSWHDDQFGLDSATSLSRLNLDRVIHLGYANLRCWWDPGCPDHIHPFASEADDLIPEQTSFRHAWLDLFPWRDIPVRISHTCCSQFALSKERIRSVKLAEYVRLRDWILGTELEDSVSGRVMEYIWQVIWTGNEILCPVEWACYCHGFGICFGGAVDNPNEGETEEERNRRGYEEYSVKRSEWTELNQLVEEFVEGTEGFSLMEINLLVEKVEFGETVEEVVKDMVDFHLRNEKSGGGDDEKKQDLARRLEEVIKAAWRKQKELLPWLMDKMGRAKGEIPFENINLA